MSKYLIAYSYYRSDLYGEKSLEFFINHGIFDNDNYDFYFIINGLYDNINKITEYIKVFKRKNNSYDFGAWSDLLFSIDIKKYDYFIFLNNSVIGPCLPRYLNKFEWPKLFSNHINNEIKIVGCTLNHELLRHIQSYCFCVDKIGLNILLKNNIFCEKLNKSKSEIIEEYEIKMLECIENEGYKGYTFDTIRNYDNISYITNINITNNDNYKNLTGHDINQFEFLFIKPRSNDNNIQIKYYLKSLNLDLDGNRFLEYSFNL